MRILFLSLIAALSLAACDDTANNGYNAKSADECIFEKECVWDAFEHQIISEGEVLHKWQGDIRIQLFGDYEQKDIELLKKGVDDFKEILPIDITLVKNNWNVAIIYSPDIKNDFKINYKKSLSKMFSQEEIDRLSKISNDLNYKIYGFNMSRGYQDKSIAMAVQFIQIGTRVTDLYTKLSALNLLQSRTGNYQTFKYSAMNKNEGYPNDLDILMIRILYDSRLIAGDSYVEVKNKFSEIYNDKMRAIN